VIDLILIHEILFTNINSNLIIAATILQTTAEQQLDRVPVLKQHKFNALKAYLEIIR
jgi:hypothetical protein